MGLPYSNVETSTSVPMKLPNGMNIEDVADEFEKVNTSALHKFVEVRGVKINYVTVGTGAQGLLLMNGSMGHIDSDFGPILSKFSNDFTVVAWDYPGCGKSRPPNRDFSSKATFFHNDADFGHDLMKKLGFEKFSVLGWCGGGVSSVFLAVRHSDSVKNLILCGTRSHFTDTEMTLYRGFSDIKNWSPQVKAGLMEGYEEEYFLKSWTGLTNLYFRTYDNERGNICQDELVNIKCPTLVIHGEKDPVCPVHHAHYLHKHIPNSKIFTLPAGKHNLHLKYTEEFIQNVEGFVRNNST